MTEFPDAARRHLFAQLYDGARLGKLAILEALRELPEQIVRELIETEKESDNEEGSTALLAACRNGHTS